MASGETREARLEGIKLAMNAVAYYRDTRSNITDTGCVQKSAAWAIYRRLESLYEDWSRFEPAEPSPTQREPDAGLDVKLIRELLRERKG